MAHVVAVAGHPGAGKTTLVLGLVRALGDARAIHMDGYENMTRMPVAELARWAREGADIDAFRLPQLEEDLARLKADAACRYVLFETQFGRAHRATGRHVDFLVWVDTPLDIALARNVLGSLAGTLREPPEQVPARLRWLQGYVESYLGAVRPLLEMQKERVAGGADLRLDGRDEPARLVARAREEILRRLP